MASKAHGIRSASLCSSCLRRYADAIHRRTIRPFSQHAASRATPTTTPVHVTKQPIDDLADLSLAHTKAQLREAAKRRTPLIGSLRYRWAVSTNQGIPFEQLPYQCFQEARKILGEQRNEVLKKIETMRLRIQQLSQKPAETPVEVQSKQNSLLLMSRQLEKLKIEADINDPMVKRRFEDGIGDMNKPIYRHLADKKWREYRRSLVIQRLETMSVVPDLIDKADLVAAVDMSFPDAKFQPGEFVQSLHSQLPPRLHVQVYDAGPRLVSVVVVDPDVPDFENDDFTSRCHGLYVNIEVSPTNGAIDLAQLENNAETTLLSWLPPHAHKGGQYHRLVVFVVEHYKRERLDPAEIRRWLKRDKMVMRYFLHRTKTQVKGATMFRTQWDEGTAEVMTNHNLPGLDIQMKRKPSEKAPYKPRDTRRMRG